MDKTITVEIYPREGTETTLKNRINQPAGVEIYPREGTETLLMQTPPVHFGQLKFIPVRGRRLKATIYITALCKVKIYPREGTETIV